ncbi:MAG: hypothetical protein K9N49_05070 [Candidatus Marinimicrobia bacterium]|nr:hypothetical protein [Candidatus Neomarinimicrobiota bacterium]
MKTAEHPFLPVVMTHDPTPQTYRDNQGTDYESVTSFVKRFFPAFDQEAALTATAIRTGRTELKIAAEWRASGDEAATYKVEVTVQLWAPPTFAGNHPRIAHTARKGAGTGRGGGRCQIEASAAIWPDDEPPVK